jgi:S-adenosylmethionine synthetase
MARYVAKNVVAAGLADRSEIQLAYVIGGEQPLAMNLNTFGTGKLSDEKILAIVKKVFDFSPAGIIKTLNLRRPIYRQTAAYGHFGRSDLDLPWEEVDQAKRLRKLVKF